jgi:hypothetical protein
VNASHHSFAAIPQTSRGCSIASERSPGEDEARMTRYRMTLAALAMIAATPIVQAQQISQTLPVNEVAPGDFVHIGVTALMN